MVVIAIAARGYRATQAGYLRFRVGLNSPLPPCCLGSKRHEVIPMREYDEDDDNIRRSAPVLRRVIILVAVIIAVPVMMWPITNIFRSYVERPTPTVPAFDP